MRSDGCMELRDYTIVNARCACDVYPVALGYPMGRCGKCHEHPQIIWEELEE